MNTYQFLKLFLHAAYNIKLRLWRSILTSLGIIIGTATIVVVIALGLGAQKDIEKQYSNLSVTSIFVFASKSQASKLGLKDVDVIKEKSQYIVMATPQLSGKATISTQGAVPDSYTVVGVLPDYKDLLKIQMLFGDFISEKDSDQRNVVLGYNVAEDMFGTVDSSIIGKEIKIDKKTFKIIGIIDYRGGSFGQISIDDSVYIPYNIASKYVLKTTGKFVINTLADTPENIEAAIEELRSLLRESHKLRSNQVDDFKIKDMGTMVQAALDSAKTMTFLLGGVALIVLIVGGIGIMNIMLVSVKERTKEIGIRKAIGAKPLMILVQFLDEALILSFLGALFGLGLAIIIVNILMRNNISVVLTAWAMMLAAASSILTGLFFGFYPARAAALQNPIDSLRTE